MRLVIIGAGFAGMYAALSAARLRDIHGASPKELEIALVAPEPTLVVRPRLYEPKPETLTAPLLDVLKAIDVVYVQGSAETIDTKSRVVQIATAKGTRKTLSYHGLVVATGSKLFRPNIPGLAEHDFSVDSLDDAIALDKHLHSLPDRPAVNGRDTVVVTGGGFTGIEAATEMPTRLRAILGKDTRPRVIIVDRNKAIAPAMGEGARPVIEDALKKLGVETRLGAGVASLDESGVTLSNGEHIETETVVWAAGFRAAPLTQQIPGERDNFGRLLVDRCLSVPGVAGVFATGDAARAACDDVGNYALSRASTPRGWAPSPATTPLPNCSEFRPNPTARRVTSPASTSARPARCSRVAGSARWRWSATSPRRPSRRSTPSGSIRRRPSAPLRSPRPIRSV
jgi:NADH dehydrogenase